MFACLIDVGVTFMLIRRPSDIPSSEITAQADYMDRRKFMAGAAALGAAALGSGLYQL